MRGVASMRGSVVLVVGVAAAAGCGGPDLAKLEVEQQSLEQEVGVLRKNVDEMRALMEAMGKLPSGPAAAGAQVGGGSDLRSSLDVKVTRDGTAPTFPALPAPERRDATPCGYRFYIPWLETISDHDLEQSGAGRASPIELTQNGKPLIPHVGPVGFERGCKFSFRHQPKYLFFSPQGDEGNVDGAWEMHLSDEVPLARADDSDAYWVYPGTTLTFTIDKGWSADQWGELKVQLDARLMYVGTPEEPSPRPGAQATVAFLGVEESGSDPRLGFESTPEPPDSAWTIDVTSPSDGPYVLLESLVLGNTEHALVVVAPPTGGTAQ